jgi:hypothetical protein
MGAAAAVLRLMGTGDDDENNRPPTIRRRWNSPTSLAIPVESSMTMMMMKSLRLSLAIVTKVRENGRAEKQRSRSPSVVGSREEHCDSRIESLEIDEGGRQPVILPHPRRSPGTLHDDGVWKSTTNKPRRSLSILSLTKPPLSNQRDISHGHLIRDHQSTKPPKQSGNVAMVPHRKIHNLRNRSPVKMTAGSTLRI